MSMTKKTSVHVIHADHIVTMNAELEILTDGAIAIDQKGIIVAVGSASDIVDQYRDAIVTRMHDRVLMPGLVNTHAHSGLLRGTAEGLPVWEWLEKFIDPMHRVLRPQDAEAASRLCYGEALLSGTTTIVDMWRHMNGSAKAATDLGIRAVLVPYVAEHPEHDYFETLDINERLIEQWHGAADGRIQVWVGMEHMFYATESAWQRAIDLACKHKVGFHTHSNESRFDVVETERRYGMRPVEALSKFGLLDAPKTLLAHCVWLSDSEIEILRERQVGVAHNPISNMKLASGAARITDLLSRGVVVGLGTDGEKENNNFDMFEEMKTASLLAKLSTMNAAALDAWTVCKMATIDGARALGLDHCIGSLEVGKQADLIAIKTNTPRMTPLIGGKEGNLHHNLVHAVQGGDVDMTMVSGKIVAQSGNLVCGSMCTIIDEVNRLSRELFQRITQVKIKHTTK